MSLLASILFGLGAILSLLNFYLSFVRPIVHRLLRRGPYHFVSGIPLFGSLLLLVAYLVIPHGSPFRAAALFLALLDTGGIHWFGLTMLYHSLRGSGGDGHGDEA
jgi:hypothetical protein